MSLCNRKFLFFKLHQLSAECIYEVQEKWDHHPEKLREKLSFEIVKKKKEINFP